MARQDPRHVHGLKRRNHLQFSSPVAAHVQPNFQEIPKQIPVPSPQPAALGVREPILVQNQSAATQQSAQQHTTLSEQRIVEIAIQAVTTAIQAYQTNQQMPQQMPPSQQPTNIDQDLEILQHEEPEVSLDPISRARDRSLMLLQTFTKQSPPDFRDELGPIEAKEWLLRIEILDSLRITDSKEQLLGFPPLRQESRVLVEVCAEH